MQRPAELLSTPTEGQDLPLQASQGDENRTPQRDSRPYASDAFGIAEVRVDQLERLVPLDLTYRLQHHPLHPAAVQTLEHSRKIEHSSMQDEWTFLMSHAL